MTHQRQHFMMRLLVIGAFVFSGAAVYLLAHWLVWNDPVYQRLFWSPFRPIARLAQFIDLIGFWWPLAAGLMLGLSVVVIHAMRSLLLAIGLLILCLGICILVALS
jgi:hypothetical protein